jgi:hypothetical protein
VDAAALIARFDALHEGDDEGPSTLRKPYIPPQITEPGSPPELSTEDTNPPSVPTPVSSLPSIPVIPVATDSVVAIEARNRRYTMLLYVCAALIGFALVIVVILLAT